MAFGSTNQLVSLVFIAALPLLKGESILPNNTVTSVDILAITSTPQFSPSEEFVIMTSVPAASSTAALTTQLPSVTLEAPSIDIMMTQLPSSTIAQLSPVTPTPASSAMTSTLSQAVTRSVSFATTVTEETFTFSSSVPVSPTITDMQTSSILVSSIAPSSPTATQLVATTSNTASLSSIGAQNSMSSTVFPSPALTITPSPSTALSPPPSSTNTQSMSVLISPSPTPVSTVDSVSTTGITSSLTPSVFTTSVSGTVTTPSSYETTQTATTDNMESSTQSAETDANNTNPLPLAAIIGIVVGGTVAVVSLSLTVALLICFCCCCMQTKNYEYNTGNEHRMTIHQWNITSAHFNMNRASSLSSVGSSRSSHSRGSSLFGSLGFGKRQSNSEDHVTCIINQPVPDLYSTPV